MQSVLELVREGLSFAEILRDYYPGLEPEDLRACIQYAIDVAAAEEIRFAMKLETAPPARPPAVLEKEKVAQLPVPPHKPGKKAGTSGVRIEGGGGDAAGKNAVKNAPAAMLARRFARYRNTRDRTTIEIEISMRTPAPSRNAWV